VDAGFTFDPGPNPRPGQEWEVIKRSMWDMDIPCRVLKASYPIQQMKGVPQQAGLLFVMDSDSGVSGA